jgi:hypothetical protein
VARDPRNDRNDHLSEFGTQNPPKKVQNIFFDQLPDNQIVVPSQRVSGIHSISSDRIHPIAITPMTTYVAEEKKPRVKLNPFESDSEEEYD